MLFSIWFLEEEFVLEVEVGTKTKVRVERPVRTRGSTRKPPKKESQGLLNIDASGSKTKRNTIAQKKKAREAAKEMNGAAEIDDEVIPEDNVALIHKDDRRTLRRSKAFRFRRGHTVARTRSSGPRHSL
jgi:hypothetical protein